jgi:hypothetical protein
VKANTLVLAIFFSIASIAAHASPTLVVGTPANSLLATPTGPYPVTGGTWINFDNLPAGSTYTAAHPFTYGLGGVQQVAISGPDDLIVEPFSTQSAPNFLVDNSGNGTADVSINLTFGSNIIGVGIADSDPVSITLQALGQSGPLGSPFIVNLANTGDPNNPGNGYYFIQDTSFDIYGLQILQTTADPNFSGLAIDDVQFGPEPASVAMCALGGVLVAGFTLRKRRLVTE